MGNWRKLLWRLWLVFGGLWVLVFMVVAYNNWDKEGAALIVIMGLLAPLVVLAIGRALVWAIDGLRD